MRKSIILLFLLFFNVQIFSQTLLFVDPQTEYQTMEGFGGFGPKKVWWSSAPYFDQEYLNQVIDNLGSSFIRTQIYWDGELQNDDSDPDNFNWNGFNFGPSSDNGKQFEFLKALQERNVKVLATVWTPPVWMKQFDNPEFLPEQCYNCNCPIEDPYPDKRKMCGGKLKQEYYHEFAEYLAAYLIKVKQETGMEIFALNIQNEPLFANPFESNLLQPAEFADVLKIVGEKLERENINTKLFGPEHMGEYFWGLGNIQYVDQILEDPAVKQHLDFYAVHSYVDGVAADYGSAEGWTKLYNEITVKHGKQLWMTETSDGNLSGFDLAYKMARSLHLALRFGHISGWVYWYFADVAIKDNQLTKLGYAFKNYYKYIEPGAVYVNSHSEDSDLLITAFKKGEQYTVVIINNGTVSKNIALNFEDGTRPGAFEVFRTSSTEDCKPIGVINNNNLDLPGQSITTITGSFLITGTEEGHLNESIFHYDSINKSLELNLWTENSETCSLEIIDLYGRKINSYHLPLKQGRNLWQRKINLPEATYVLRLMGSNFEKSRKIIVQ